MGPLKLTEPHYIEHWFSGTSGNYARAA